MPSLSITEENYLKAIFKLSEKSNKSISTNNIASEIKTKAASVSDMIRKKNW
jgi:DtxR family transcriptional regulator, Mn-dependent transcriptional regulator